MAYTVCKHLRDIKMCLLKTGACLIQLLFGVIACIGNEYKLIA